MTLVPRVVSMVRRIALPGVAVAIAILAVSCGTETNVPTADTAASVTILTTSVAQGTVGVPYSQTLQAVGGTGTFTWSVGSGTLLQGLSLSAAGVLSGTPTLAETGTFTAHVVSGTAAASQPIDVTVVAAPVVPNTIPIFISTTSLPTAIVGVAYSQAIATTGGGTPQSFSLLSGRLPTGFALSSSGVITGTATAAGSGTFTVVVISGVATATQTYTLTTANPTPPLAITTTALAGGTTGFFYSQTLVATGGTGTYAWTVNAGTLPAGMTLSAAGVLSGIPTTIATSSFTVQVTSGALTATQALSVVVTPPPLVIPTTTLGSAINGAAYSHQLQSTGGTGGNAWVVLSGALPPGLSLSAGGLISGTPTTLGANAFTVQVTSGTQTASQALSLTVVAPGPVVITSNALADGPVGVPYSVQLNATGGINTYTWSVSAGALPAGITLSASGLLSGTPAVLGTSAFTVQATSGAQNSTKALSILVDPVLAITTAGSPADSVGFAYNQTLAATGGTGTYTWSIIGSLPPGLAMSAGGVITGTPTTVGSYFFNVKVVSGSQLAAKADTIVINPTPPVVITTLQLAGGLVGTASSQTLTATGGTNVYTWSVASGSLPLGMSLSSSGMLSGTPTAVGTSAFTVQAASGSLTATQALTMTNTVSGTVIITTMAMPNGKVGTPYSFPLLAVGGLLPYTWAQIAGTLPAGLTLNGATGVISGTPSVTAINLGFTVKVTSGALTALRALALTITP